MSLEQVKSQLDQLTQKERAELAYILLRSLEPEEEGAAGAWEAEVSRRATEIRSGKATGRPADEVFAELRERYP